MREVLNIGETIMNMIKRLKYPKLVHRRLQGFLK